MRLGRIIRVFGVACGTLVLAAQAQAQFGVPITAPAPLNTNAGGDFGADSLPQVTTDGLGTWVTVWASADNLGGTIGYDGDILVAQFQIIHTAPVPTVSEWGMT